jgi:hypothetical protein
MRIIHKKVLLALIFVFLFVAIAGVHALEVQYPEVITITGEHVTINDDTTPTGYVVYIFYFLVALAGVIAFMVVVWGGFNLFMAGGESGKVSEAKNQILGAFIGLLVLFSIYIILGTINRNILEVNLNAFNCNDAQLPICVETTKVIDATVDPPKTKVLTDMSIPKANDNLILKEGESITIKKYQNLQEIWGFTQTGFKGSPILVYRASSPIADLPEDGIKLSPTTDGTKLLSYKIIDRLEGIYLYDNINTTVGDGSVAPYYLNTNVPDFSKTSPQFFKKAQSAQVIAPRYNSSTAAGILPTAIFFSEPQYRGFCRVFVTPTTDNDIAQGPTEGPAGTFGYNLASAVVFKSTSEGIDHSASASIVGDITFYNNLNCRINSDDPDSYDCPQSVKTNSLFSGVYTMSTMCPPDFSKIKSIKINGPVGVILIEGNKCQFFSKKDFTSGNCISSILDSSVSNADSFRLIPTDEQ